MISILYVDTRKEMCCLIRHIFEETGSIAVYLAGSGEEALASFCRNRFDVIVSDYHLPGMSGGSLLRKLRSQGIRTPFIFFTHDFTPPLSQVARFSNVFRFNGKQDLEKREVLQLLRIVYWVTGKPNQTDVIPYVDADEQQGYDAGG